MKTLPLIKHPLYVRNLTFLIKNTCSEGGTEVIFSFPLIDGEREVQRGLATFPGSLSRSTRILLPVPRFYLCPTLGVIRSLFQSSESQSQRNLFKNPEFPERH